MELSALSVKRTDDSPDFWDPRVSKIVVVVARVSYQQQDCLLAYGVDPDHLDTFLFLRMLPAKALGAFFKTLVDGELDDPELDHYVGIWLTAIGVMTARVKAKSVSINTPVANSV